MYISKQPFRKSKQPFRKSKQPFRRRSRIGPGDRIDYRNMSLINQFISEQGKILSKRVDRLTLKQQVCLDYFLHGRTIVGSQKGLMFGVEYSYVPVFASKF